jgi:hypothetical protein
MRDYNGDINNGMAGERKISRKEALRNTGKYALFTAASMMTILNPLCSSAEPPPKSKPKPP